MLVKQGQIYKLDSEWSDSKCNHATISFPTDEEGNDYYIVDALPCNVNGDVASGYIVGVPMNTENFIKLVKDV